MSDNKPVVSAKVFPASGLELDELHPDVSPADDLYRHVNERWLDRHPIPEDKSMYGAFSMLAEEAEKQVRAILEQSMDAPEGSEQRKVGDFYRSFMDGQAIEKRGLGPLRDRLRLIDQAGDDPDALISVMGRLESSGTSGLCDIFIDNDPGNPERYVVFVEQSGLSLPDESYYREEQFESVRDAFLAHLERVATLVGFDHPKDFALTVLAVESDIASHHWDQVTCRDAQKTYNLMDLASFESRAGRFNLRTWSEAMGLTRAQLSEVVLRQPSFVDAWGELWCGRPAKDWAQWLQWQVIRGLSPYLTEQMVEAHFDFYGRTLSGTPSLRARWKRGVSAVEAAMGEAVGKLYVERHFPAEAKAQMDELVGYLLEAYRQSISELSWMSEVTKARALEKLEKFRPKIGYPNRWRDYSDLEVDPTDLVANVEHAARWEMRRELSKLGKPIDRDEWFMTPQTVNAYYNPGFNEIVFPAAILQYPFFDPHRDPAANYGAIGAVIGHEIGHGFDDQGSRFDGDGRLLDWWEAEDRERFDQLTRQLVEQYSALELRQLPGHRVNGELTLGENIGDLGGLAIAWKAYLLSLQGNQPPVVDGVSAARRFFIAWAHSWRLSVRDEEARRLLQIDPHSPAEFRCNQIVRNLDVFYDAFDVTAEDALFLPVEQRVSIW